MFFDKSMLNIQERPEAKRFHAILRGPIWGPPPKGRVTCTGRRSSKRPGSVLKMVFRRSGTKLTGRSTKMALSPKQAVTRSVPLMAASSNVVAPCSLQLELSTCLLKNNKKNM